MPLVINWAMERGTPNYFMALLVPVWLIMLGLANMVHAAPPPAPLASIPVELSDNRIHAAFSIENRPQRLLLDTGASVSLLFPTSGIDADRRGDSVPVHFPAFGTSAQGHRLSGLEIRAGEFRFTSETILLLANDAPFVRDFGGKFTGILGRDFLRHFVVEVMPSQKLLKLYAPDTDLSPHYRLRHTLVMDAGAPYIIHRFRLPWESWPTRKNLLLDTGYPGGVALWNDRHFDRATEPEEEKELKAAGKGIVYFGAIRFGKLLFRNIPVFVGPSAPDQPDDRHGLIGASMFLPFRYVIDLGGGQLLLTPRSPAKGVGFQISNDVIYTPGDEDFILKDFRPKPSATPVDTYHRNKESTPGS